MIGRRAMMKGAAAVTGDGLVKPLNAPPAAAGGLGIQPGAPSVVVAHYVIVTGATGGVFEYNGTPGPGNPPVAWMSQAATDPYGNAILPSVGTSNPATGQARMNGANILLTYTPGGAGVAPAALSQVPAGVLNVASGGQSLADPGGALFVFSKAAGGISAPGACMDIAQGLYGTNPALGGPQTWQAMSLINGWVNNASFGAAKYRPLGSPPNSLEVTGVINANAVTSTVFWAIPAQYGTPASAGGRPAWTNTGNAGANAVCNVRWDVTGNLSINNSIALPAAAAFGFGFTIPLDA